MRRAIVIGGGVGGLSAAIHLARAGMRVTLFERAPHLGGKLREVELAGRRFTAGPSVLTMRWVFEELFGGADRLRERVPLVAVDPLCRHFFADGSQLDLFSDEARSRDAIAEFAGEASARGYTAFRRHAAKIFEIVRGPFMEQPVGSFFDFMSPRALLQLTQIDGTRTLMKALEEFFVDPRLRQLFGRYATYNGSSPYHAPGTLAVIAHVENAFGIFRIDGGIYRLAEAMAQLLRELGVEIVCGAEIEEVLVERGRVTGVRGRGIEERADVVVANCDIAHVYERLLPPKIARKLAVKYGAAELSLSAYVWLAVAARAPMELVHHNVFFSGDYRREFDDLIERRRPPEDPTVYVLAEDADRYYFLTNAPPLDRPLDWNAEAPRCRERIEHALARRGWRVEAQASAEITPADFAARFPSSRGAIYGVASNSMMAAFKRPSNRVSGVAGLYTAGGTVHPGAGLPMVALSAKMASQMAVQETSA